MCMSVAVEPAQPSTAIRCQDYLSQEWLWLQAPCRWRENVELTFRSVPYLALEGAGSRKRPDIVSKWLAKLEGGEPVPPPVVCLTERGTYYVRDGNHRHEALGLFLAADVRNSAEVRVAIAVPKAGFGFRYRRYGHYGTYQLERIRRPARDWPPVRWPASHGLLGRVLVLAAHPDDETACAWLLQRAREPAVWFLTDGAPASGGFWGRYGSPQRYAAVRRLESRRALAAIGISDVHFLNSPGQPEFEDQELYRALPAALSRLLPSVEWMRPEAILAPTYEGGHPDHDACSFLAHLIGQALRVPIWEMPLYHRSRAGVLLHQQFVRPNGTEVILRPRPVEGRNRDRMVAEYASQTDLAGYLSAIETFRPQADYDYSRPPHEGSANYELWEWPMTSAEVCTAFADCLKECGARRT